MPCTWRNWRSSAAACGSSAELLLSVTPHSVAFEPQPADCSALGSRAQSRASEASCFAVEQIRGRADPRDRKALCSVDARSTAMSARGLKRRGLIIRTKLPGAGKRMATWCPSVRARPKRGHARVQGSLRKPRTQPCSPCSLQQVQSTCGTSGYSPLNLHPSRREGARRAGKSSAPRGHAPRAGHHAAWHDARGDGSTDGCGGARVK